MPTGFLAIPTRRLAILVAVGGLLIGLGWQATRSDERPMGSGPAGPAVDPVAFAKPWSVRPVVLLGLGDSVTAGYGASPGNSFFDRLRRPADDDALARQAIALDRVLPRLTAVNKAVSCSTSFAHVQAAERLRPWPAEVHGVAVITTGGNDLIHDYGRGMPRPEAMYGASWDQAQPWIAGFAARLDAIVAGVRRAFPGGCRIFVATIYDPTDGEGNIADAGMGMPAWPDATRILAAYNHAIRALPGRHPGVHVVDVHRAMLGHGINHAKASNPHHDPADPTYWYYANLEDPNDRGYDAIRRAFLAVMAPVLATMDRGDGG